MIRAGACVSCASAPTGASRQLVSAMMRSVLRASARDRVIDPTLMVRIAIEVNNGLRESDVQDALGNLHRIEVRLDQLARGATVPRVISVDGVERRGGLRD